MSAPVGNPLFESLLPYLVGGHELVVVDNSQPWMFKEGSEIVNSGWLVVSARMRSLNGVGEDG